MVARDLLEGRRTDYVTNGKWNLFVKCIRTDMAIKALRHHVTADMLDGRSNMFLHGNKYKS